MKTIRIIYEGKVIGAIGVSGNTPQEDEDIAIAGAAAAEAAIKGGSSGTKSLPTASWKTASSSLI